MSTTKKRLFETRLTLYKYCKTKGANTENIEEQKITHTQQKKERVLRREMKMFNRQNQLHVRKDQFIHISGGKSHSHGL